MVNFRDGGLTKHVLLCRESTGPGGPDVVFQYSGPWTLQAYARGATRPRGTIIAQVCMRHMYKPCNSELSAFGYCSA